jgi:hypothetical protein
MTKFESDRQELITNLDYLKSLPVKEYILRKKWDELQTKLFADRLAVHGARHFMWRPIFILKNGKDEWETVDDIINHLDIQIDICNGKEENYYWEIMRTFSSSAEYNGGGWRRIRFFVKDMKRGKVLGVGELSSDLPAITSRDKHIGWDNKTKFKNLRYTAILSTCVPTQPFGFNFNGGKLIAALSTSPKLREQWFIQYNEPLVAITTTSLYGSHSMYNGIKWFKPLKSTDGAMPVTPDDLIYRKWVKIVRRKYPKEMKVAEKRTGSTIHILNLIGKMIGISFTKDYRHEHKKGVYFAEVYENTKEFLRGEIKQSELIIKPKFTEDILDWWRPKAIERYKKVKLENRLAEQPLFYNHAYLQPWPMFKKIYLGNLDD